MWQSLMDWLPDLKVGTFELRDVISVIVGGVGIYLAYLATKIAAKQDEILEEQRLRRSELLMRPVRYGVEQIEGREWEVWTVGFVNMGKKAPSQAYWRISCPYTQAEFFTVRARQGWPPLDQPIRMGINDGVYVAYRGTYERPIYRGPHFHFADVLVRTDVSQRVEVLWRAMDDDGEHPATTEGRLDLESNGVARNRKEPERQQFYYAP